MPVIGTFHFHLTKQGNLLGEYDNDHTNGRRYVEAAQRQRPGGGDPADFIGTYHSTWFEAGDTPLTATLIITRIDNGDYRLNWHQPIRGGELHYQGTGTKKGDRELDGDYHSVGH